MARAKDFSIKVILGAARYGRVWRHLPEYGQISQAVRDLLDAYFDELELREGRAGLPAAKKASAVVAHSRKTR